MIKKFTFLLSCLAIGTIANAQLTVTATPTAGPTCNNGTNGSATLNFSGCTGPFTYTINGGAPVVSNTATASLSNLAAGTYTVAVTTPGGGGTQNLFTDNFDNTTAWTLNTSIGTQGPAANAWVIDDFESWDGVCGSGNLVTPGDKTLHVYCTGNLCSLFGTGAIYNAGGFGQSTLTDKFASTVNNISTIGSTGIQVKFAWRCMGQTDIDYGTMRYSIDGGTNWVELPTKYQDQDSWACATVNLPVSCENISTLKLGFRWRNDNDGVGSDPTFAIDDLVVTGNGGGTGCSATTTFTLDNPAPFVPTTNLTGNVELCQGDVLTLSATNANNCTPLTITSGGSYTLTCQNQAGCAGTSAPVNVTIVTEPVANFTFTQIDNYTVEFTSTSTGSPTSYTWILSNNTIGNTSNISYNFPADANYNVTLVATNACGTDTITLPVQVIKVGINETSVLSTFNLFPNPASNQVMLQLNAVKPINGVVKVVTQMGQIVAEEVVKFNGQYNKKFDITNLATGIYSIVVISEGESFSRKLVVE
jgi:PKD repeat protein